MRKWTVRKRHGVWQVVDHRGKLRFAAADWRQAFTFASLCGRPLPKPGRIVGIAISYEALNSAAGPLSEVYREELKRAVEEAWKRPDDEPENYA